MTKKSMSDQLAEAKSTLRAEDEDILSVFQDVILGSEGVRRAETIYDQYPAVAALYQEAQHVYDILMDELQDMNQAGKLHMAKLRVKDLFQKSEKENLPDGHEVYGYPIQADVSIKNAIEVGFEKACEVRGLTWDFVKAVAEYHDRLEDGNLQATPPQLHQPIARNVQKGQ